MKAHGSLGPNDEQTSSKSTPPSQITSAMSKRGFDAVEIALEFRLKSCRTRMFKEGKKDG
jgi:hypothetical protein